MRISGNYPQYSTKAEQVITGYWGLSSLDEWWESRLCCPITRILLHLSYGRSYLGKRADQQRFYNQLNITFLVLGYIRWGVYSAEAKIKYESERDYAAIIPTQV
jgi:hypothetical protein